MLPAPGPCPTDRPNSVSSQEIDALSLHDRLDPVGFNSKFKFSELRLVHSRETRYVQIGPGVRDLVLRSWCDVIQHPGSLSEYGRRRAQGHPDAGKRLVAFVSQNKAPDDRDVVWAHAELILLRTCQSTATLRLLLTSWGFQSVFVFLGDPHDAPMGRRQPTGYSRQTATGTTAGRYYPTELQTRKGTAQR